jgi:regulator of replication initiation timing
MANETKGNGGSRWAGVILTAVIAMSAFTVQWGVVTTKLDHVEKRLDELIVEARALRAEYQSIERRVSYLEDKQNGRPNP